MMVSHVIELRSGTLANWDIGASAMCRLPFVRGRELAVTARQPAGLTPASAPPAHARLAALPAGCGNNPGITRVSLTAIPLSGPAAVL